MLQNPQRLDQFTDEIAEMRLPGAATSRERTYLRAGLALMAAGVIVGVAAYVIGHGTTNPLQQRDAIVLAVVDIGLAVGFVFPSGVGAFAFIVVLAACAYVVVRVWRLEHTY